MTKEQLLQTLTEDSFNGVITIPDFKQRVQDYAKMYHTEQCAINGVVFNEAVTEGNWVLDEPEPLYKDYDTEIKSEVELFCSNCKSTHVYQPEPESIKCYRCGFYGAK